MSNPVSALLLLALVVTLLCMLFLWASFTWGRFSAKQVRDASASVWKAYLAAMLPSVVLGVTFLFQPALTSMAFRAFLALGSAALIGAYFGYHRVRLFAEDDLLA